MKSADALSSFIPHPSSFVFGEVQEWLNWQHWKCCERETVPWVRIPPSPPEPISDFGMRILNFLGLEILSPKRNFAVNKKSEIHIPKSEIPHRPPFQPISRIIDNERRQTCFGRSTP